MCTTLAVVPPPVAAAACRHCGADCDRRARCARAARRSAVTAARACSRCLQARGLATFYTCDRSPACRSAGARDRARDRFAALDDPAVAARFDCSTMASSRARRSRCPDMHCASCVWLLERLWRVDEASCARKPTVRRHGARLVSAASASRCGGRRRWRERLSRRSATSREGLAPTAPARPPAVAGAAACISSSGVGRVRLRQHHALQHSALRQWRRRSTCVPAPVRHPQSRARARRCCSSALADYFRRPGARARAHA